MGEVTVIIPAYNAQRFIQNTLDSVLNQTFIDWTCIVINDGSTDKTQEILDTIKDPRFKVINQENQGVAVARNKGIKEAESQYIAFLDADDALLSPCLEEKISVLNSKPEAVLVHAAEQLVDFETGIEKGTSKGIGGKVLDELLLLRNNVIHSPSSVVVRSEILRKVGAFNTDFSTSADWELWTRLADAGEFAYLEKPLSTYHLHREQMHLNVKKMEKEMLLGFKLAHTRGFFKTSSFERKCRARLYSILGASYIGDQKKYLKGLDYLIKSFLKDPSEIIGRLKKEV